MARPARQKEYQSDFQKWIHEALERSGISLTLLATKVGADYSHLWRIASGDLQKYPNSRRPGYELTETIGKELKDLKGAMVAAGYWKTDPDEAGSKEITIKVDPAVHRAIELFTGMNERDRKAALRLMETLQPEPPDVDMEDEDED